MIIIIIVIIIIIIKFNDGKMDRWELLILNLICHVNPGNGQSVTWVQGCIRIHSQQRLSRLY